MNKESKQGRTIVLAIIVSAIAVSLVTIALSNTTVGSENLPEQLIRFLMIVMGIVYGASAIALGASRSVDVFLHDQGEGA